MANTLVKQYTSGEFRALLSKFQDAIDKHEYIEKIPYDTWRKLMKLTAPITIKYTHPFVKVLAPTAKTSDSEEVANILYSSKVYSWGFGRFFYDYVIKKENERMANINTISDNMKMNLGNGTLYAKTDNGWNQIGTAKSATVNTTDAVWGYGYSDSTSNAYPSNIGTITTITTLDDRINRLEDEIQKKVDKECVKENNTMMKGINFDFGPCGNTVRLSMYGMAIQNVSGEWVSYNPDSREIINVDVFNMADGGKYMYKMPVAIADVKEGDIVIHNRVPMFVTAINENGTFEVTDVRAGETKNIIPTRSPFGFNFITKIVSLFGNMMTPNASNPFGNMWMFAFMSDDKSFDMKDMVMLSMMSGNDFSGMNPMMLMLMADNKGDKSDWLMPLMLMNGGLMGQTHTCKCEKTPADAGQI